eukprot:SAG11_NODE_27779_length_329_cov_0.643478_1_plen_39_part_10
MQAMAVSAGATSGGAFNPAVGLLVTLSGARYWWLYFAGP